MQSTDPQHRAYHHSDPGRVQVRESDDDGMFVVRMPLASTGEVRNQGDDPLSDDEIQGMADQVENRSPGVFLDHGSNAAISGSRYSATGKVGEWANPELTENDAGETLLEADARMMDPDTLPDSTGAVREALSVLKAQADRGIGLSSSIGWRTDDAYPGGVDLMEASIVGIPADPRTTSQSASPSAVMARSGLADRANPMVMGATVSNSDHDRHLSGQQAEIAVSLLNAYRDEQGDGSVENFESWLWNVAYYQFDENEFHAAQTALQEFYRAMTPMDEAVSEQFIPFLQSEDGDEEDDSDEGDDARDSVTTNDNDQSDDSDDTTRADDMDATEYRESMLEMQRQQTEILSTLADSLREDDEDDEETEDEDEEDEDDESEQNADPDGERSLTVDGEDVTVEDIRDLREQLANADPDMGDDKDERESTDTENTATTPNSGNNKWGI